MKRGLSARGHSAEEFIAKALDEEALPSHRNKG